MAFLTENSVITNIQKSLNSEAFTVNCRLNHQQEEEQAT